MLADIAENLPRAPKHVFYHLRILAIATVQKVEGVLQSSQTSVVAGLLPLVLSLQALVKSLSPSSKPSLYLERLQ